MTTRPIIYEITVQGADDGARAFDYLARAERGSSQAMRDVRDQNDRAASSLRQGEQNTARYAQALGTLGQGLQQVSRDMRATHPELSEFLRLSGEISTSLAQNTQAFGPWGGAIVTALERIGPALADAIDKWSHFDQLLQETRIALGPDLVDRLIAVNNAMTLVAIPTGTASSTSQHQDSLGEFSRRRSAEITANIQRMQAEDEEARQRSLQEDIAASAALQGNRGGQDGRAEALDRARAVDDEIKARFAARAQAINELQMQQAEQERAAEEELQSKRDADYQHRVEQERVTAQQIEEIRLQEHNNEIQRLQQRAAAQTQAIDRLRADALGFAQPITNMFVSTLSKVIAGGEDAGKVFQGLLSDFLGFISQQAALKAAFEFAEAIATFPYGTAQHVAAGLGFTAVAVAAGVGSVAVAPPSTGGAPANPPANQSPQQSGSSNVTINWNSPVVTAQDRAELGRSLTQTIGSSTRRFASSV